MYFSISPSAPSTSYSTASAMDITTSSRTSRSPSCAYPSWPRRTSLSSTSSASEEYHNHSFVISDEELFGDVFEDDTPSTSAFSSPSSDASRSPATPARFVVESGSLMREVVRKEKQERAERRKRSASTSSKKSSRRGSKKEMSAIQEVVE